MNVEGPSALERLGRGRMLALAHPSSELFSGYGLTTHNERSDRLVGLLMIDRPHAVDPEWLAQVEALYGECQVVPMTRTGERGLVTQMHVLADSVHLLQPVSDPVAPPLHHALRPLLDVPPAPILKLRWDEGRKLWQSAFWIGLPPALQQVFAEQGYGCLAAEQDGQVVFITHAADADISGFRHAPVLWHWQLVEMETAPLIRFEAAILDRPQMPYRFEHFLNVGDPEQARCLNKLVRQEMLTFDFFGSEFEYAHSQQLPHQPEMRQSLDGIVRRAIDYYGRIPAEKRNFDVAKAAFQQRSPL